MMKGHLAALAATTAVIVGASYIGWSPPDHKEGGIPTSRSHGQAAALDRQELDRLIGSYEQRVGARPNEADFAFLGQLYMQRGRQTGDVQTYLQAEQAVKRALTLAPDDAGVRLQLAGVRYTTHDFPGALDLAQRVLGEAPDSVSARIIVGDAQMETGHYGLADDAYKQVASTSPHAPAIEVRQARLAFIQGNVEEARRLAALAEDDAVGSALGGPDLAFYEAFRGQVEFDTGHYDRAVAVYNAALEEAPDYYVALAGLAKTRSAQGHRDEAIALYERAVKIIPQPEFVAALGDLYALNGDKVHADLEYGTVAVIAKLAAINRQVYNRQLALFDADHARSPEEALRLSETELQVRKDVYGYDAYAWALYQNRRFADARKAEDQALAIGTVDAKLLYHSGLIAKSLGDTTRAQADLGRALAINPGFDALQARTARTAVDSLSSGAQP
jgi:tetratricopeptide (TPR) repeat protein